MPFLRFLPGLLGALSLLLVLGAACCGNPCSETLVLEGTVPNQVLAPGDTLSIELFPQVWTVRTYCDGGESGRHFPEVRVSTSVPGVATASLEPSGAARPSRLLLTAHGPGTTLVVLQARAEVDCATEVDATHFALTVRP